MKKRILSAIVVLAIVIPIIIKGGNLFYFATAVIGLFGFKELLDLKEKEIPFFVKLISAFSFLYLTLSNVDNQTLFYANYKSITLILFFILIPLVLYRDTKKYNIGGTLFLIGSVFFLGVAFNYLIVVRSFSLYYLIFLLLITIVTDTFAHITGTLIGRNKLCPTISPHKTIEGLIGGLLFGTFVSTVFYVSIFDYTGSLILLVLIVMLLSLISQLGDLVFSSIKRYFNIKDFSNLIPGHGGILDRLDSILFVLLAFSFIIEYI